MAEICCKEPSNATPYSMCLIPESVDMSLSVIQEELLLY